MKLVVFLFCFSLRCWWHQRQKQEVTCAINSTRLQITEWVFGPGGIIHISGQQKCTIEEESALYTVFFSASANVWRLIELTLEW